MSWLVFYFHIKLSTARFPPSAKTTFRSITYLLLLLPKLQSGLHSEVCEIDYKLHNIISGRKRCVVQTIQEETGTNIYFPTPLSGVLGSKNSSLLAKQNLIFITGEFFGVQRARDMLFQVSLHKVSSISFLCPPPRRGFCTDIDRLRSEQIYYIERCCYLT